MNHDLTDPTTEHVGEDRVASASLSLSLSPPSLPPSSSPGRTDGQADYAFLSVVSHGRALKQLL